MPDKASNLQKLNANVQSGEIMAPVNDTQIESREIGVRIEIGDNIYNDFSEYELIDKIGSVKAAIFIFLNTDGIYPLNLKDEVKVYDENGLFLTGRISNLDPHVTTAQKWVQVEIKSHAGILVDTDCPYPLEFLNQSLKAILSNLAEIYGQEITFSDDTELDEVCVNEIGTSFAARPNERVFSL